jgi:hypothetical protein
MAYDPYDRGDNPWRSDFGVPRMDMPRSRPSAKPGAGRASAAAPPPKKKRPAETDTSPKPRRPAGTPGRKSGPEITAPLKEDRTDLLGNPVDPYGNESERLGLPQNEMFPPKIPEMNLNPDERNVPQQPMPNLPLPPDVPPPSLEAQGPPIPGGLLAGPTPGFRMPENARRAAGGIFDTGPVEPLRIPPSSAPPPAPRPSGPRSTPFDTGPVTPMQTPDWLRRLFGAA